MIHDNVCESQKVNSISFEAEALWFRLLTVVDDNGNFYRDVRRIYPALLLEKKGASEGSTERAIKELLRVRLVAMFTADQRQYIHVIDFEKYQDLRLDGFACVQFPIHPSEMGAGYTGEGRRSAVLREAEALEIPVVEQYETGDIPVVRRSRALEVEVEVKGKEEVEVTSTSEIEDHKPPNYRDFQRCFKQAAGRNPKTFPQLVERYEVLCRKYGEHGVLDSINAWVEQKGGKAVVRKTEWAPKNFLVDDAEDILDARIDAANEPLEGEEISRMARAGRAPAVQM